MGGDVGAELGSH